MTEYTPTTEELFSWLSSITTESDVRSVRRWLAERDRQVAERAWDEGERAGSANVMAGLTHQNIVVNPYRKEATGD